MSEEAVEGQSAAAEEIAQAPAEDSWKRALIVAGGRVPSNVGKRKVVVVEQRGAPQRGADGEIVGPGELKTTGYPRGGDLYFRIDSSVEFPADAEVLTLNENVRNKGGGGFSARGVKVGPTSPAYAGANLAWQRGATDIEISGLSKDEQEALAPWFTSKIPDGVTISFA